MNYLRLKKKQGIIYESKELKTRKYLRSLFLRVLGNFLIIISIFSIIKVFFVPVREEISYFINQKTHKYLVKDDRGIVENKIGLRKYKKGLISNIFGDKKIEILRPINPEFNIIIPKIGANSRIIAQVDASNKKIYLPALKKGVAQALGSSFPGERGHIFLFAHSTDFVWNIGLYNGVFYLLNKLEKNDEVDIFYKGQRIVYKVIGKKIVNPSQVEFLTRKTNKEFLTLQTCWPLGTSLKRLLVFAVRAKK